MTSTIPMCVRACIGIADGMTNNNNNNQKRGCHTWPGWVTFFLAGVGYLIFLAGWVTFDPPGREVFQT